jgi:hypothetical protein
MNVIPLLSSPLILIHIGAGSLLFSWVVGGIHVMNHHPKDRSRSAAGSSSFLGVLFKGGVFAGLSWKIEAYQMAQCKA